MTGITRYPINMDVSEREVVREIIYDQRHDILYVWTQLTDKTGSDLGNVDAIYMNAYEQGFVVSCIAEQRDRIPGVWKRLIDSILKFREEAGVVTTDLGNSTIQLVDNEGIKIVRQKYDWEM